MKLPPKRRDRKREGLLFVISAPSGAGKSTLCRELLRKVPNLSLSVSFTTRQPRKGEIPGVHYTFISEKKFRGMINRGEFAEWAVVHGNFYGTSLKRLKKLKKDGHDVLLDIDIQGARQVRRKYSGGFYVFILPPSMKVLKQRLTKRGTDSRDTVLKRLERAKAEIAGYKDYDYVIINDKLETAYRELESVVLAARAGIVNIDEKKIRDLIR